MPQTITTKPGDKYRSLRNPKVYEALRRQGYSKQAAARISNAQAKKRRHKSYTLDQLEQYVCSPCYDPAIAQAIAERVPQIPSLKGEQIAPGITRIRGNLCNVHGKYGPCDKGLSGKKPKGGKGPKARKPIKTPEQRAAERQQQKKANVDAVKKRMADSDTGLAPAGVDALAAFAEGKPPSGLIAEGLARMGLAERAEDGSYRMTPTGRAAAAAMQAGDYQRAVDTISRGSDQASARQGRQAAATGRQQAAAQRRADAEAKRQQRAAERAQAAGKKPAKAGASGGKKPEAQATPAKRKPIKMPSRSGAAPSSGGVQGAKPKKPPVQPKPEKPAAPEKQETTPELAETARNLSDGKELSDDDTQALIRNGLARIVKGELVLTAAGQRAIRQKEYEAGQLCPYCTADLALPDVGWYRCGNCGEAFYADDTDSDYEDYHARRADRAEKFGAPAKPTSMPTARVLKPPREKAFAVFKDARGQWRWVAQSSTAYQDRDREIVSTKALADDCAYADETGQYGVLRWWHSPGLDLGDCDFNAMHGRVLIESGTFRSEAIAQKVARAADGLEISLGFLHPPSEPDAAGVFHHIRRFERSLVPRGKASNRFTAFTVKESIPMDATKVAALKALGFSDSDITDIEARATATEKAATDQGVAFKADEPASLPDIVVNGVTYKAFPPKAAEEAVEEQAEVVETDAVEEMPMDEEPVDDNALTLSQGDLAAIVEAVAPIVQQAVATVMGGLDLEKKVASHVQGFLAPVQQAQATKDAEQAAAKEQIEALTAKVKELEGDQPATPYRASQARDNVVTDAALTQAIKSSLPQGGPFDDIIRGLGLGQPQA